MHADTAMQTTAVVGAADMRLKCSFKAIQKGNNKAYTHANTITSSRLDGEDLINAARLLIRQKRQLQVIKRLHEACDHRSVKRLINLKG